MSATTTLQYYDNRKSLTSQEGDRRQMEDMAREILEPSATTRTLNAVLRAYLGGFYKKPLTIMSVQELSAGRNIGEIGVREILHARQNHQ